MSHFCLRPVLVFRYRHCLHPYVCVYVCSLKSKIYSILSLVCSVFSTPIQRDIPPSDFVLNVIIPWLQWNCNQGGNPRPGRAICHRLFDSVPISWCDHFSCCMYLLLEIFFPFHPVRSEFPCFFTQMIYSSIFFLQFGRWSMSLYLSWFALPCSLTLASQPRGEWYIFCFLS